MPADDLLIRNVEIAGRAGLDVLIEAGKIAAIGPRLASSAHAFDGRGGALIPGLADHHIHLFALAAQADSVSLDSARTPSEIAARIAAGAAARPPGAWLRVTGLHESAAGALTRDDLDRLAPRHRLRVQHQTGSLWLLNTPALESVWADDAPDGLERDGAGRPTGRLWRADAWLRTRINAPPPPLAPIGRALAACGVTAATDATVTTGARSAALLADAARSGALAQRLALMSAGPLAAPEDGAFAIGPVKIVLDEHDLPDFAAFGEAISRARAWGRPVAVHCVTAAELALTLAAFEAYGACAGDRIEHGGVIAESALPAIKRLGLIVVTQPAFVHERGDRYLADIPSAEHGDLYRCASLIRSGAQIAGSTDAPYGPADPWAGMRAAVSRRTRAGRPIGLDERTSPETALALFLGSQERPDAPRRIAIGAAADLCLLKAPMREALHALDAALVAATFVRGAPIYEAR